MRWEGFEPSLIPVCTTNGDDSATELPLRDSHCLYFPGQKKTVRTMGFAMTGVEKPSGEWDGGFTHCIQTHTTARPNKKNVCGRKDSNRR